MQCKQKRNWKSHPLWNTPHCLSSLIDSTPPSPGPNSNSNFFTYIHISGIWFIFFFSLKLHSLWICNFHELKLQLYHNTTYIFVQFFSQITLHINLHLWFNYSIFMNWNVNCITTYTIIDLCMLSFFHFFFLFNLIFSIISRRVKDDNKPQTWFEQFYFGIIKILFLGRIEFSSISFAFSLCYCLFVFVFQFLCSFPIWCNAKIAMFL